MKRKIDKKYNYKNENKIKNKIVIKKIKKLL